MDRGLDIHGLCVINTYDRNTKRFQNQTNLQRYSLASSKTTNVAGFYVPREQGTLKHNE